MKKQVLIGLLLFLVSCRPNPKAVSIVVTKDSTTVNTATAKEQVNDTRTGLDDTPVLDTLQGDFNGDGIPELAFTVRTKEGRGDIGEDGSEDEYEVHFSNPDIPILPIQCCEAQLVKEGDLDKDKGDEITTYAAPFNGVVYTMETYTLKDGKWKTLVPPFMFPVTDTVLSKRELEQLIFVQDDSLYYLDFDMSNDRQRLVKKKVSLVPEN